LSHIEQILSLILQYGYLIVFFGVMAESVGVPMPGETILIASGILAQQSKLNLGDVILFGFLGAVIGDQIGYWLGRKGGRPFVLRWGQYVKITPERLASAEGFFARHGGKAVFLARFIAGLRVFGALVAGISQMHWRTFIFYNALGGAVWATAAVLVGYLLGGSLSLVERWMGRATVLIVVLLVLAAAVYLSYRWVRGHPELLRRWFTRLGGRRLQSLLESPAGLWLRRRLAPGEVYGLALTIGLTLLLLFSWALAGIAEDVLTRDPLVKVDLAVLQFFHSHSEPYLTSAVVVFETILSPEVLLVSAVATGAYLIFLFRRRGEFWMGFSGGVILATALGTGTLVELFKLLFNRPRPPASLQLVAESGNGFPSAHAMTVLVLGATVWYLFTLRPAQSWGGSWRARVRVGTIAVVVTLLVGLGRVYTGAHYPSDVLGGWALGGVWASICLTAAELFRRLHASGSPIKQPLVRAGIKYTQFSLVGASNALVDLGVLNLLLVLDPTRSPGRLVLYNAVALVLANINSYLWNTLWTFRHRSNHDARQLGLFILQAALNVAVGSLLLWLSARWLLSYTSLPPLVGGNVSKVLSMVIASSMSFFLLRFIVFRNGPHERTPDRKNKQRDLK
jgi:undecaprenyl-diphosphatase